MKTTYTLLAGIVGLFILALAAPSFAAENKATSKEVTITGEAMCAMCALKQSDKCQTVIQVQKGDKTLSYYLADNDVSKSFHKNICKETKKATATGTVQKVDGKLELTATEIELVK